MSCLRTTILARSCSTSTVRRYTSSGCGPRWAKLGVYADWVPGTTDIAPRTIQLEYYDYTTPGGLLETDNRNDDPAAQLLLTALLTDVLPNELRAPLPAGFVPAQTIAKIEYLGYVVVVNALATREDTVGVLPITVGDI